MSRPAVFLDRDGTLNAEKNYLHRIEDWEWLSGVIEAISIINQMGYLAIVVTNQAGIARGYYSEDEVRKLHRQVDKILAGEGSWIDAYYYCPHHPNYGNDQNCNCRKPKPGMLLQATADFNIDLDKSFMIGDKALDIFAGISAGVTPILVATGYGLHESELVSPTVLRAPNLFEASKLLPSLQNRV